MKGANCTCNDRLVEEEIIHAEAHLHNKYQDQCVRAVMIKTLGNKALGKWMKLKVFCLLGWIADLFVLH